jgi:SOS-response transcriptional repressor LexA
MNKGTLKPFADVLLEACKLRAPQLITENNELHQNKAAEFFGIPQPTFFRWMRTGSYPKDDKIKILATKLKLRPSQMRGEEPLPADSKKTASGDQIKDISELMTSYGAQSTTELTKVPVISLMAAGQWNESTQSPQSSEWRITTANVSHRAFAVKVEGDSMTNPYGTPSIPHGSIVIIDPDREAINGKIVVAKLPDSDEAVLKKLVVDGPNQYLKPLNPNYEMIKINDTCRIIGVVVQMVVDF